MDRHGGNVHHFQREMVDFSANIHPDGMPEAVKKAMEDALSMAVHYPDPEYKELKQAICKKYHIEEQWVICGNGAADLLYRLAMLLKPKKVLLPVPAFVEYEEAFTMPGIERPEILPYQLDPETFLLDPGILKMMTKEIDILILCNPNNPTGRMIDEGLLKVILNKAKEEQIFLLLDECFLDFVTDGKKRSMIAHMQDYKNVFILRSFTKMYAIAGIRLGFGICANEELIRKLEAMAPSWTINHVAQRAGIAACQLDGYEEQTAEQVAELRGELYEEMRQLPIRIWEGSANYLFFQVKGCETLRQRCMEKGICIRQCHNYRGIGKDYYRVAVRGREENRQLLWVLRELFEEGIDRNEM